MPTKMLGMQGEILAQNYLTAQGYQIIERNFKNKIGEIDIIAKQENVICFCEVKTRRSLTYGQPYESVNYFKMRKLSKLALSYLKYRFGCVDICSRFDVISIYYHADGSRELNHIRNAFDFTL
jgi:putative endonuclease